MDDQRPYEADIDDLGPPVRELRELRLAPSAGFLARIRGSIHRRLFASDSADFALRVFFSTMFDYLDLIMHSLAGTSTAGAKEKD